MSYKKDFTLPTLLVDGTFIRKRYPSITATQPSIALLLLMLLKQFAAVCNSSQDWGKE
jgi:hypothetical protein